jgi:hypothetical protein
MIATRRGQERAGAGVFAPGSNQRDSEAAGLHTTPHCLTLIPRRRVPLAGSVGAKRIYVEAKNERPNGQCVLCDVPEAKPHAQPRNGVRSVACGCSFMPTRRVADGCICKWRSRGSAKPTILTHRWWSEADGWSAVGAWAAESSHARSPTVECQTNQLALGPPSVRSAIFPSGEMERQRNVAVGKMAVLTVIAMSCPGGASRTIACWPDEVSRPFYISGAHDLCPDCLDSLRSSE